MNDQVILSVTKRGGGLEVTTRGTGHDQLAAIEAVAASAWRVMTANRNVPPDAATGVILLSVQRGIQTAAGKSGHMNMELIGWKSGESGLLRSIMTAWRRRRGWRRTALT